MAFFTGATEYSILPRARCPQYADLLGIYTRADAWNWVSKEIKGNIANGKWLHADSPGAIANVFARTFALIGNCRFPSHITHAMAREWFGALTVINERRMGRQGWPFSATSHDSSAL